MTIDTPVSISLWPLRICISSQFCPEFLLGLVCKPPPSLPRHRRYASMFMSFLFVIPSRAFTIPMFYYASTTHIARIFCSMVASCIVCFMFASGGVGT
ncbi:hypothetical protein M405DRAFT_509174 [Rhizopogon salebrosus TDB-379]|nr:hypothetical protein M405DRAFT_509174 [Rhizopogon salebrosus TDB-379]